MREQKKRLGPLRTRTRISAGTNEAVLCWAPFDNFRIINRADLADPLKHRLRERGTIVGIEFVKVKAVRLPIFVQTEAQIKIGLSFQPGDMSQSLFGFRLEILAVQIGSFVVFAPIEHESCG